MDPCLLCYTFAKMRKEDVERLSTEQILAIRELPEFPKESAKLVGSLLKRDGLQPMLFKDLHEEAGCTTTSEYLYSKPSGLRDPDFFEQQNIHFFVRKRETHGVKSSVFSDFSVPEDWDRVAQSRQNLE
jgi:hypothetical protein